jgi:signal transduction histidine kinase/ActR/RegA family two-component response regulator
VLLPAPCGRFFVMTLPSPNDPAPPASTRLRRGLAWLGAVDAADPVRRALNQGLAWVLLAIAALAVLMAVVLMAIGRPALPVVMAAATAPVCLVCWWINRRGSTAGAVGFVALMIVATSAGIEPALYAGRVPTVDVAFMYGIAAAALFVRPTAALVALVGQLGALCIAMAASSVPLAQALAFLAEAVIELGAMAALLVVASSIFVRALEQAQRRAAAEAANEAKTTFLANMSHELRTPLNAILGFAQLLALDPKGGAAQHRQAGLIRESGEHLLGLIEEVLDIARVEAGRLELHPVPIDLGAFIDALASMARVRCDGEGIGFVCEVGASVPGTVVVDERRLRQVLLNLVDNAAKFTDAGKVTLRVEGLAGDDASSARLRFAVEDTGCGIAAEDVERVFRPFEQVGAMPLRRAGAGLGLAISQQLVRLMHGEIRVDSTPGAGSTFRFEIAVPCRPRAASSRGPMVPAGYEGRPRTVLVADDVPRNRALLRDIFLPLGFRVHEAGDGKEATDIARRVVPDLIVVDAVMPLVDGVAAVAAMRATPSLSATPIVAVSASAMAADSQRCLEAGADAFLPKPIDVPALLNEVRRLLGLEWSDVEAA